MFHRRAGAALAGALIASLALAACGSNAASTGTTAPRAHGTVDVLYAGSLVQLMDGTLGPRFTAATGYRISGVAAGSAELGNEIKGGVRRGDVFVSASPSVDTSLEGAADGRFVSWYAEFARVRLVLGYNSASRFAAMLRSRPWYEVVTTPGFLLGRTDPVLDPKGVLTVEAVDQTAQRTGDGALRQVLADPDNVFPEETLVGRLQAGQLDAGFFYADEAKAAAIPTVALTPVSPMTTFTVTVLDHASNQAGALAFVQFLLGEQGRRALDDAGFVVLHPAQLHGTGTPRALLRSGDAR